MKATRKEVLSVITIAIAALVFALTLLVSAQAAAVEGDRLLMSLALAGAIAGGINGFGRRMTKADARLARNSLHGPRMIAS